LARLAPAELEDTMSKPNCSTLNALAGLGYEVFAVLFLDAQHRLIGWEELFRGTLTQTSVYPREVVRRALGCNCAAVILAHNHPLC
jgi:DNA repair protein RadC